MNGVEGLLGLLKTNIEIGLQNSNLIDKQERISAFGRNNLAEKPSRPLWTLIVAVFEDYMLRLISIFAILSAVLGICQEGLSTGWTEGATILFTLVIIALVSAINDYFKDQQFIKLARKLQQKNIEVIRDGKPMNIPIEQILVGDIYTLKIDEIVPVDGVLVTGSQLIMDESAITGELDLIEKNVITNAVVQDSKENGFIISGSKVIDGTGKIVVCAIGENSFNGKLNPILQEEVEPTPLQIKLENVANDIGKQGILIAALIIIILIGHLIYQIIIGEQKGFSLNTVKKIIDLLLLSAMIISMAIPEGLPLAVTTSLAYSVNKMKDQQNMVRTLASCELMSEVNNICADKTGTLTQNIMKVTQLYFEGFIQPVDDLQRNQYNQQNLNILGSLICINSEANPIKINGKWEQLGNKTECALIAFADQLDFNYQEYRPSKKIIKIFPFNSYNKRTIVLYQLSNEKIRVLAKGASESILQLCNFELQHSGMIKKLDKSSAEQIEKNVIQAFAQQNLRTIGMAYKDIDFSELQGSPDNWQDNQFDSDLTLLGIAGIKDPLRPQVKHAIEICKTAGITMRMFTGDNIATAINIAKECGILPENFVQEEAMKYQVMQGSEFREMVGNVVNGRITNINQFKEIAKNLRVLARSAPQDKYTLVTGLQQLGNIVAVVGDGTNDAPALKKADIGFAMGIEGTEVAKEVAGIILLDDNFHSIVTACKWGRNIVESVRKFLQFQLTGTIVVLVMILIGAIILGSSPLNVIQMLWINLIIDIFGSLALTTEPPNETLLKRQPQNKNESIITPSMWRNIIGQVIYQIIILTVILFMVNNQYSEQHFIHSTIFFQTIVLMQLFNQFNCRNIKREEINIFSNIFNNPLFWLMEIIAFIIQILLIEFGGKFLNVSSLTIRQHFFCILLGLSSIIFGLFIKLLPNAVFNLVTLFKEKEQSYQLLEMQKKKE